MLVDCGIDSRLDKVLKAYFMQTAANVCEVEIMAFVLNISIQTVLEFQLDLVKKCHIVYTLQTLHVCKILQFGRVHCK